MIETQFRFYFVSDLTDEDITAQAGLFFIAGFDTSSTFLSFAAYALALHPEVQQKLYEEITRVIQECDGKLTYEGVMSKMTYLDMVASGKYCITDEE